MKLGDAAKLAAAEAAFGALLSRPSSLLGCYDPSAGRFDSTKLSSHMRSNADAAAADIARLDYANPNDSDEVCEPEPKRTRRSKYIMARRNEDGEKEPILPKDSWWYSLYVSCPMLDDDRFHTKFRRRFRLPYQQYLELVEDAVNEDWFPRWSSNKSSPVELLILGSLRYLGRGFTFDDCEENTAISEEVHRIFFHQVKIEELC